MIECGSCGKPFDGTSTRWLCPTCGFKNSCCDPDVPCPW